MLRFTEKAKIFDVGITAVAGIASVAVMLYAVGHFGLKESWHELVLNVFYVACLVMIGMYFFNRLDTHRFNYWCTVCLEMTRVVAEFPSPCEKMSIEEMMLGYTINGAKQLGIEATKGSITAGKDADFLVFDNDLLTAAHTGFSYNKPSEVYFCGKKMD